MDQRSPALFKRISFHSFCCKLCALLFLVVTFFNYSLYAGGRPGAEDAACDAVALRYRSQAHKTTEREMNFFLFEASTLGCLSQIGLFLDKGASIVARDRLGNTALLIAAKMGHTEALEELIQRGGDAQATNLAGSTSLLRAVSMNRRKAAKFLLDAGVDPNRSNKKGLTPLIAASFKGNRRLIELLLAHGADPLVSDASGKAPIVYAAAKGYSSLVELLTEAGELDIDKKYGNNLTVLMWAAGHSNDVPVMDGLATVEYLLSKSPDLDAVDNRGKTALIIAASRGHELVVKRLVEAGANPDVQDNSGKTALELSVSDAVKSVLQAGVN